MDLEAHYPEHPATAHSIPSPPAPHPLTTDRSESLLSDVSVNEGIKWTTCEANNTAEPRSIMADDLQVSYTCVCVCLVWITLRKERKLYVYQFRKCLNVDI